MRPHDLTTALLRHDINVDAKHVEVFEYLSNDGTPPHFECVAIGYIDGDGDPVQMLVEEEGAYVDGDWESVEHYTVLSFGPVRETGVERFAARLGFAGLVLS